MQYKGVVYDIGTEFSPGRSTRSSFDPTVVRREIEIIGSDLHCTAIRLCGGDLARLRETAEYALMQGLTVWFSPLLIDANPDETLRYLSECSRVAEELRRQYPEIVFVVGNELSFFMKGILPGDDEYARIRSFVSGRGLLRHLVTRGRWPGSKLNPFLSKAAATVRNEFDGRITYGSGPWEHVDWQLFDLVSVNYYRDAGNARKYRKGLAQYYTYGKPVAITEFGCCTYKGAGEKGAAGWNIIDTARARRSIRGRVVRSEETQSRYLSDLLSLFMREPIAAAFVFQFAGYNLPTDDDPEFDLDMASYGIVKVLPEGREGVCYPGMPWEPKLSFQTVADLYTR
ncbi:MAG: abortive infection protein [Methanospirillum sp.]